MTRPSRSLVAAHLIVGTALACALGSGGFLGGLDGGVLAWAPGSGGSPGGLDGGADEARAGGQVIPLPATAAVAPEADGEPDMRVFFWSKTWEKVLGGRRDYRVRG